MKDLFSALFFFLMQTAQMMQRMMKRTMASAIVPTIKAIRSCSGKNSLLQLSMH
jgi:hypothetical protein